MNRDQFEKAAEAWIGAYAAVCVSAVGINTDQGKIVFSARITFGGHTDGGTAISLGSNIFWQIKACRPLSKTSIKEILDDLSNGRLPFSESSISIVPNNGNSITTYFECVEDRNDYGADSRPRQLKCNIRGGNYWSFLRNNLNVDYEDAHLRSLESPFSSLKDVFGYYDVPVVSGDAVIELIVDPPITISFDSAIGSEMARVNLKLMGTIASTDVRLGYICQGRKMGPVRASISGNDIWLGNAGPQTILAEITAGDAPFVDAFLSYKGYIAHCVRIISKEVHLSLGREIHSCFDFDSTTIQDAIFNCKKSNSRAFEDAVSLLFELLGFSVMHYGGISAFNEDAPDIVAITPSGRVAVIECTLGLPDQGDQIAKVLQRAQIVRKGIERSVFSSKEIHPVIVTTLPENEISIHRDAAIESGVSVIFKESLHMLMERLVSPPDAETIYNEILGMSEKGPFRFQL